MNKRSKSSRQRGHKTHGYGSMKKNRGAGHRGGRGNAGSGKRGDAKKPSFLKDKKYMGKHGFKKHGQPNFDIAINLGELQEMVPTFIKKECAQEKDGVTSIDLTKAKFTKLLSKGVVTGKLMITVDNATPKAIEKVAAGGGKVVTKINKGKEEA